MNLEEIEAIKQLKARYFRFMDTKQWDKWGMVWTEDAELHNPSARPEPIVGRAEIQRLVSSRLANTLSVHHGHMPEITITGEREANGVWAMYDLLMGQHPADLLSGNSTGRTLIGYGHYIEQYRKDPDGQWRIRRLELRRLHTDEMTHQRSTDPSVFPS